MAVAAKIPRDGDCGDRSVHDGDAEKAGRGISAAPGSEAEASLMRARDPHDDPPAKRRPARPDTAGRR
jgi:hypothetical protein